MPARIPKKLKIGANVSGAILLALGCWILIGWINLRHYHRFDCTAEKFFSLSEKTLAVLKGLKKPVTITTLFRPGTPLEENAKDMLSEYASHSKNITLATVDPDRDAARVQMLAQRLKLDSFQINSVLFETEGKTKQVTPSDMEAREPSANPFMPSQAPPKFKGEEAFTSAILNLTEAKVPQIYFTIGHGENDYEGMDRGGVSELVKFLRRENYEVKKLATLQEGSIPTQADTVVIASAKKKFLPEEIQKLQAYLKGGGRLLLLLDPLVETGLEPLLKDWGIQIGNDVVLDPVRRLFFAGPATLVVSDFGVHPIAGKLRGSAVLFSLARSVKPTLQAQKSGQGQVLCTSSAEAWGEMDLQDKQAKFDEGKDEKGPLSLAVAVAAPVADAAGKPTDRQTRVVVFGDGDFLTNLQLSNASNLDFFTNAMNWLNQRENLISIGPKPSDIRPVTIPAGQMRTIFWFTVLGMPLFGIVGGSVVRYRRRK